jgi:hypothetical protein
VIPTEGKWPLTVCTIAGYHGDVQEGTRQLIDDTATGAGRHHQVNATLAY